MSEPASRQDTFTDSMMYMLSNWYVVSVAPIAPMTRVVDAESSYLQLPEAAIPNDPSMPHGSCSSMEVKSNPMCMSSVR